MKYKNPTPFSGEFEKTGNPKIPSSKYKLTLANPILYPKLTPKNNTTNVCMQTFVVLFLGVSLGYKIGLASVSLYLLEGILGFPVFSNSPEKGVGFLYFTGPTMGYLIGFL